MISFQSTDEEKAFSELAKGFALEQIRPLAGKCEEKREVGNPIQEKAEEFGFLNLELPLNWGGLELPLLSQVQILQALSYGDLGVVQGLKGPGDAASLFRMAPENGAFDAYRKTGIAGPIQGAAFLDASDPEDPSNKVEVTAVGNGYALYGTSFPIRLASFAEYLAVAVTDREGETLILWLDHGWHPVKGDYRLGLLSSGCGRIEFEGETFSNDALVARGKAASQLLTHANARIRVLQAAKEVGLMEAALDYTVEYTAGRKTFGKEIAKFQGVSYLVADMAIEARAARNLVWQAAFRIDRNEEDSAGASLRALAFAHRSVRFVTNTAVQMLGGHGYVKDYPVEKWMRDAQAQVILYGREHDLLVQRGEQIIHGVEEEVAQ